MKTFVINLDSRPDRLKFTTDQLKNNPWQRFKALNGHHMSIGEFRRMGFNPYLKWNDPLLKRTLTNTEIATAISHYRIWEISAITGENVLILEDDNTLEHDLDIEEIDRLLETYDIVYLDHREMFDQKTVDIDSRFKVPYYAYWNNAYAISPRLASKIIRSQYHNNVIPVDEFFPLLNGVDYNVTCLGERSQFLQLQSIFKDLIGIKSIAYKESIFKQVPRKILGSDIESGTPIMSEKQLNVHVLTVGTDPTKMSYLKTSSAAFGINVVNIGEGVKWNGGDMTGPGGGQKINLVKNYLNTLDDNDVVLFVDGYDVFFADDLNTITERFLGFNTNVLFAAEINCWPEKSVASFFDSHTKYKYLNSGLYMGYVKSLKHLMQTDIQDSEDDQLYFQRQYIVNKFNPTKDMNIQLDVENYIFQCLADASGDVGVKSNKQLINTDTMCCPCIVHGNGGTNHKQDFEKLYNELFQPYAKPVVAKDLSKTVEMLPATQLDVAGPDILEIDFLTPEMCQLLIDKAEAHGKWESMYGDKFPGQELRIREFDMDFWNRLEQHFVDQINPLIEPYWFPLQMYGLRDAFIIKYNIGEQTHLSCHHDASLVTGLVKLNTGYEGGDTYFHRQHFSNINTPIGRMILWPGQVTHGHEGRSLHSGTKYNLVIWTARKKGDINY